MTSRPLLASVAESIVILAPMSQVGWRSAWAGVAARELVGGRVEERPARRGQDERRDGRHRFADQALPDRRVLRVDRPEPGERARERVVRSRVGDTGCEPARLGHDQVAAGDQGLLVGRRHDLAGAQGGQHGPQADDAAGGHDDEVDVVARGELDECRVRGPDHGDRRLEPRRLLVERRPVRAGRERDDPERGRMGRQDLDGLPADGAGRSEEGDAAAVLRR